MASKEDQHQALHYITELLQDYYGVKSPVATAEDNSPKQTKAWTTLVPNGSSGADNIAFCASSKFDLLDTTMV